MFIIYLDFEDALRMHTAIAYLKKLTALALLMSTHNLSHDQDSSQESRQSSGIIPEPEVVTLQVSDMVQDDVASFSAPQLAAMCGAYVQLCRHSYNDSLLFDAIVEQILRSFKVFPPLCMPCKLAT